MFNQRVYFPLITGNMLMYLKKVIIKIFVIALALLISVASLQASEAKINISVDKNEVTLDDTFTLTVLLSGEADLGDSINSEDIPALSSFRVIGDYSSISTNLSSSGVETVKNFQYVLQPIKSGTFVIGPVQLQSGGQVLKSNSIAVTVLDRNGLSTPVSPTVNQGYNPYQPSDEKDMWVVQELDKKEVYANEQVTLTFKFYYRTELYGSSSYQAPQTTGFTAINLYQSSVPTTERIDGIDYYMEEVRTAFFAISSGEKVIGPTTLSVPVDFFGYKALKSNDVTLNVKPLPQEGRPENFSGAVGEFIVYFKVDKEEVDITQPVSLELVVEGWGNVDNIGQPVLPQLPGFKAYTSGTTKENSVQGNLVYGKKKFKYTLMPVKSGNFEIPEITYPYFNPSHGKYEIAKTKPVRISVSPGTGTPSAVTDVNQQEEIKIVGQDINHIKTDISSLEENNQFLYKNGLLRVIVFFSPIGLLISFFYKKHIDRLNFDVGFARLRRAYKGVRKNLSEARKYMKDGKEAEFYSIISRTLREYIGDKFNLPPAGLTQEQICSILKEKAIDKELMDLFCKCYESCEYARFAPDNSSQEKMSQTFDMAEKLLSSIEKRL